MSTNYYANWNIAENVTVRLHIGQFAAGDFMLSGVRFPTWDVWKEFLTHNEHSLTIEDEYKVLYSARKMIDMVETSDRDGRRLTWYEENLPQNIDHEHRGKGKVWEDNNGFIFLNGEFF